MRETAENPSVENLVELTLFSGDINITSAPELTESQLEQGYKSVRVSDDGTIIYTMPESLRTEIISIPVKEMETTFNDALKLELDIPIKEFKLDISGKKLTIKVDKENFEKGNYAELLTAVFDSYFTVQGFYGIRKEDATITVEFVDSATNKTYKEGIYPTDTAKLLNEVPASGKLTSSTTSSKVETSSKVPASSVPPSSAPTKSQSTPNKAASSESPKSSETQVSSVPPQESDGTTGQKNALKKAKSYLDLTAFSRQGLIEQLVFDKFTNEQAAHGADANGY